MTIDTKAVSYHPRLREEQLTARILYCLAVTVAVWGLVYHGWDLFTSKQRPLIRGLDDAYYFMWLPKLIVDHDLDFESAVKKSPMITERDRQIELSGGLTDTGLRANKFPVGWALGSLPFYLVARGIMGATGSVGSGWEPTYQIAVWVGQLSYAIAGLYFAWRVLRLFFGRAIAIVGVAAGWLASPLVYYQTSALALSHSQVFALAAFLSWLALEIENRDGTLAHFCLLGFASGLLLVTRYTAGAYLILPAITLSRYAFGTDPAGLRARNLVAVVLAGVAPIALQMALWKILFGSWLFYTYGQESFDWSHPHFYDVLFSPLHGFFYWHPLMLVGISGGCVWIFRQRVMAGWMLSFIVTLVANAAWHSWWFGASFGNRAFEGSVLLAMAGLAFLLSHKSPIVRRTVGALTLAAILWNILIFALFVTKRIPAEAAVTWRDVLRALSTAKLF